MVKMFSRNSESKMLEFFAEIEAQSYLSESEYYVLMEWWQVSNAVVQFDNGSTMYDFNYIVYPYCKKGSLLGLLMKMNKRHTSLSERAQQYYCS